MPDIIGESWLWGLWGLSFKESDPNQQKNDKARILLEAKKVLAVLEHPPPPSACRPLRSVVSVHVRRMPTIGTFERGRVVGREQDRQIPVGVR